MHPRDVAALHRGLRREVFLRLRQRQRLRALLTAHQVAGALADRDAVVLLRTRVDAQCLFHIDLGDLADRKSTRLNSSHVATSYDVFCFARSLLRSSLSPYTTLFRSTSLPSIVGFVAKSSCAFVSVSDCARFSPRIR